MNRPALWIPLLLIAALFLGWETYVAWREPVLPGSAQPPMPPPPSPAGREGEAVGIAGSPPAVAPSITARPLFRPDRKPYQEPAAAALPQRNYDAELARFNLIGILLQNEAKKGIVVGKGTGKAERWEVGAGDLLPGYAVKEVRQEGLLLSADEKEFTLPLYSGGPKAQGAEPLRTEIAVPLPVASSPRPPAAGQPQATGLFPQPAGKPQPAQPIQPAAQPAAPAFQPGQSGGRVSPRPAYTPRQRQ